MYPWSHSCQLQVDVGWLLALQVPVVATSVLNGSALSVSLIPACCHQDTIAACCSSISGSPELYTSVNASFAPAAMPAPQSDGPVPGRAQVLMPFGLTAQPCDFSRLIAVGGENGYMPWPCSAGEVRLGYTSVGTGPLPGSPKSASVCWTSSGRLIRSSIACRTYSWEKIAAAPPGAKKFRLIAAKPGIGCFTIL